MRQISLRLGCAGVVTVARAKEGGVERAAARIPSDPDLPRPRDRPRAGAAAGGGGGGGEESRPGEDLGLRVRLQRLRRRADEVRRALLPGVDPVHHLRPRGGVPVPLGGGVPARRARSASGR